MAVRQVGGLTVKPISQECDRLEKALRKAVRSKTWSKEDIEILTTAALELAELELELENGSLANIWWTNGAVLRRGLGDPNA